MTTWIWTKAHKVVYQCPSSGHYRTKWWASTDQVMGTRCPYCGRRVPKASGDFLALLASRRPRYYTWCFMTTSWWYYDDLVILLCQFHDTSMRHFCKIIRKVSFFYLFINQIFKQKFRRKDETLRLVFTQKLLYVRIRKTVNL